jgi:hypothetical protein
MLAAQRTSGASPSAAVGGARPSRLLVAAVIAAAGGIVLCAALEGAVHGVPASAPMPSSTMRSRRLTPARPLAPPPGSSSSALGAVVGWVLLALLLVLALALVAVLVRLLVSAVRNRRPRREPEHHEQPEFGSSRGSAEATSVRRGIAAALEVLTEDREPADAVVRAWLGLQQSAEDIGVARGSSETPTEFTSRVLSRTGADLLDIEVLLALYLRARFGREPITATDAAAAVQALRALDASWRPETTRAGP